MFNQKTLILVIVTFITILIWVAADIYRSQTQVKTAPEVEDLLEPVDSNFDQATINQL